MRERRRNKLENWWWWWLGVRERTRESARENLRARGRPRDGEKRPHPFGPAAVDS